MDHQLDTKGLSCPLALFRTKKVLSGLAPGDVLEVEASDPQAPIEIRNLCIMDGHELLSDETIEGGFRLRIRRGT
mgnify:CR=1 FL=1